MNVNPILAHRGGLLHDLAKATHHQGMDHGQLAGEMLRQKDEPALADIADHHMLFTLLDEVRMPRTWEQKLVYYADKLVEKNELVSVDERLAGLQERYRIDSVIMFTELTPRHQRRWRRKSAIHFPSLPVICFNVSLLSFQEGKLKNPDLTVSFGVHMFMDHG